MGRKWLDDDLETHHSISANIMEAVGRGLLIATVGIVLGGLMGSSNAARFGAGLLVGSGIVGAACMIGSGLVRNAGWRRRMQEEQATQMAEIMAIAAILPIQHDTTEHGAGPVRHVERLRQERERQAGAERGC